MASLANISPSHYRNVFTRFFDVSPVEDLTLARIRRAKLLLRSSKLSLQEIAEQCGFGSMSQFYVYSQRDVNTPQLAAYPRRLNEETPVRAAIN